MQHLILRRQQDKLCPNSRSRFYRCDNSLSNFVGCCRIGAPDACTYRCKPEDTFLDGVDPQSGTNRSPSVGIITATATSFTTTTTSVPRSTLTTSNSTSSAISGSIVTEAASVGSVNVVGGAAETSRTSQRPLSEPGPPTLAPAANPTPNLNLGPIIGGTLGGLFSLLLIALLILLHRRHKAKRTIDKFNTISYAPPTRKAGSMDSSSDTPTFAHEKRNSDYISTSTTSIGGTPRVATTPPMPNCPELPAATSYPRGPSELPGPINIAPPPATCAELPGTNLNSPPATGQAPFPINPRTSTTSSTVSPQSGFSSLRDSQNTPHIMAWATFEDACGGGARPASSPRTGLGTVVESKEDFDGGPGRKWRAGNRFG